MKRSHVRMILAAIPLVICNLIAFTGQLSFIRDHLAWPLLGDIGFAAGLESMAIFLAFMAHDALMAEDSAFKLRLGAYSVAIVAAVLNYSHYSPHLSPTFAAVGTALMSAASPFLWGVLSKRASRDQLMSRGLIESRSLQLGTVRWIWHPVKSFRVMHAATWSGVRDPAEAIAAIEPRSESARAVLEFVPETLGDMRTLADAIRFAMLEVARNRNADIGALTAREITDWLADHKGELAEPWTVVPSYVSDVLRRTIAARERSAGNVTHLQRQTA